MQRDPRIRLVTKQNGGQVSATNAAYRECKGKIICFLDADDRLLPEKLARVVQAFRSHPDCGFVGHRISVTDTAGRQFAVAPMTSDPPSGWYGPFLVRYGGTPRGLACGGGQCLRREVSDLIFPVSEDFTSGPDGAIMTLAPLMTPVIGIPEPLTQVRRHGSNSNGHIRLASNGESSDSLDHGPQLSLIYRESALAGWKARRDYLKKMDPVLVEAFPPLAECQGTLLIAYIQARLLQRWGGAVSTYWDLLRADSFLTYPVAVRWFWRLSILLPRPFFRHAIGPNWLRRLIWKTLEVRRRLYGSQDSV